MDRVSVTLTVFFQEPFWVGIWERTERGELSVCRVVFGAEPGEREIEDFLGKNYFRLRFSPAVKTAAKERRRNPKRLQREVRRMLAAEGVGRKSWQALKLQQEQNKAERKKTDRERRESEERCRFEKKQQRKKEKHRGR